MPKARTKPEAEVEKTEAVAGMEELDLDGLDLEEIDLGDLDGALSEADINGALEGLEAELGGVSSEAINVIAEGVEAINRSVSSLSSDLKSHTNVTTETLKEMKAMLSRLNETVAKFDARLSGVETSKTIDPRTDKLNGKEVAAATEKAVAEGATEVKPRAKPGPKPKAEGDPDALPTQHQAKFLELAAKNKGNTAESVATKLAEATKQKSADVLAFFKAKGKVDAHGKLQ